MLYNTPQLNMSIIYCIVLYCMYFIVFHCILLYFIVTIVHECINCVIIILVFFISIVLLSFSIWNINILVFMQTWLAHVPVTLIYSCYNIVLDKNTKTIRYMTICYFKDNSNVSTISLFGTGLYYLCGGIYIICFNPHIKHTFFYESSNCD